MDLLPSPEQIEIIDSSASFLAARMPVHANARVVRSRRHPRRRRTVVGRGGRARLVRARPARRAGRRRLRTCRRGAAVPRDRSRGRSRPIRVDRARGACCRPRRPAGAGRRDRQRSAGRSGRAGIPRRRRAARHAPWPDATDRRDRRVGAGRDARGRGDHRCHVAHRPRRGPMPRPDSAPAARHRRSGHADRVGAVERRPRRASGPRSDRGDADRYHRVGTRHLVAARHQPGPVRPADRCQPGDQASVRRRRRAGSAGLRPVAVRRPRRRRGPLPTPSSRRSARTSLRRRQPSSPRRRPCRCSAAWGSPTSTTPTCTSSGPSCWPRRSVARPPSSAGCSICPKPYDQKNGDQSDQSCPMTFESGLQRNLLGARTEAPVKVEIYSGVARLARTVWASEVQAGGTDAVDGDHDLPSDGELPRPLRARRAWPSAASARSGSRPGTSATTRR